MRPYYQDSLVTIYHGDCREVLPTITEEAVLVTDPPYPNRAGHFDDAVYIAREIVSTARRHAVVFWDEMDIPECRIPLVARHVWHRTNTNRPDNYEAVYEFSEDGRKRASRVFPYPVIYPGLTGCWEATGHPTQKPADLMRALILRCPSGLILDPFSGSGTTLRAAKDLNRRAIGIEIEERYCEIAAERCRQEVLDFGGAA